MKKILYAVLILGAPALCMEQDTTPRYMHYVPKEIWVKIFSYLITTNENQIKNFDEIKKIKLLSNFFYKICDSNAIHKMASDDFVLSTFRLNTKEKRKHFDMHLFQADEKELFRIFQIATYLSVLPMVKKTIEMGVNPNQLYHYGYNGKVTALCHAAFTNNSSLTTILLDNPKIDPNIGTESLDNPGTNPKLTTQIGETPLILAAKKNHVEIIRLLLKHPLLDPEKRNSNDHTALTIALNNHQDMAANVLILDQERRRYKACYPCACFCGPCVIS